jgi:hypothetical protein
MAPQLRKADLRELEALGKEPAAALREAVEVSKTCYAVELATGELVALFGVAPTGDPNLGAVWLLGTDHVHRIPLTFLRRSKEWLHKLFDGFQLLGNYCHAENTLHIEWLRWLGFRFLCRAPLGQHGEEFLEFVRLKTDD